MYDEYYIQTLRNKLKKRIKRLQSASPDTFYVYMVQFIGFIEKNSILKEILEDLIFKNKEAEKAADFFIESRNAKMLPREDLNAAMCYWIIKKCLSKNDSQFTINLGARFQGGTTPEQALKLFNFNILDFFYGYIEEELDKLKITLIFLWKYKHRSEWFYKQELFNLWRKNTKIGEAVLKIDMISYLCDQGIEAQFTEPLSPSGRVDLVLLQEGGNKLIIEGKIFISVAKIKEALEQLSAYAKDFNEVFGYLIIFNPQKKEIEFDLPTSNWNTPYVIYDDKTIFLITVNIYPQQKSASKRKEIKRIKIDEKRLLD